MWELIAGGSAGGCQVVSVDIWQLWTVNGVLVTTII